MRVFEVDHPATQNWKRSCLEGNAITPPRNVTFAPLDFTTQTLAESLRDAGCDPSKRTFFSWLGVTVYLTTEVVMATLRFIASAPGGSGVVFDYGVSPSLLTPVQKSALGALARRVASAGEPWRALFDPASLAQELRAMGFHHLTDNGAKEINARYFTNRKDGLRVGGLAHVMSAQVG